MLLLSKNKKKSTKYGLENVTAIYENKFVTYEDSLVKFLKTLLISFDFQASNELIKEFAKSDISHDIFVSNQAK